MIYIIASTIIMPIIVNLIYGIWIAPHHETIRTVLADARSGWRRKRYVRVFIQAVKGEAYTSTADTVFILRLAVPVAVFSFISLLLFFLISFFLQIEAVAYITNGITSPEKQEMNPIFSEIVQLIAFCDRYVWCFLLILVATLLHFSWLRLVAQPYAVYLRRFSYELDRFLNRVQILASKSELAELANLEVTVKDEQSAKHFVDQMRVIANRHGVSHLVESFELWK